MQGKLNEVCQVLPQHSCNGHVFLLWAWSCINSFMADTSIGMTLLSCLVSGSKGSLLDANAWDEMQLCNQGVRIMLGGDLNALGGFKDKLFEYGAVFTEADNKEATMFCYVLFRLAEHQVALAAKELTGDVLLLRP